MIIAIDLRSIQRGTFSGVENYTLSLLERMIKMDTQNTYKLFYNGLKPVQVEDLHFLNTTVVSRRIPNKLLALMVLVLRRPKFEKLIGDFDVLFLPNINNLSLKDKKKLVVTVHDLSFAVIPEYYDLKRRLWHWSLCYKKLLRRADKIIAVSEYTKQDVVRELGVPEERVEVIYQGVDHTRFHSGLNVDKLRAVRNKYNLPGEFILYMGTLEPRKNLVGLIQAFENMSTKIHLVIAGKPGWKFRSIFDAAKRSLKKNNIHFLGFVEESDKPYMLKLARVFAFPSLYEGFGLPVLEAMAVGTPVVTSSVTSLPEVVGDAGLLVNPYNIEEITFALDQLLTDEGLRLRLTEKGLLRAKQFSWEKTAEQTLKTLNYEL